MSLFWANLVAVGHAVLVLAVIIGAVAASTGHLRRHRHWEQAYYLLLGIVIAANLLWGECPMTHWEQRLRDLDTPGSGYHDSFIGHYLPWLPHRLLAWGSPALLVSAILAAPAWRAYDRCRAVRTRRANSAR